MNRLTDDLRDEIAARHPIALAAFRDRMALRRRDPEAEVFEAAEDALFDSLGGSYAWHLKARLKRVPSRLRLRGGPAIRQADRRQLEAIASAKACDDDRIDAEACAVAVGRLEPPYAEAIRRHFLGGESRSAIAAGLGLRTEDVSERIRLGLSQLRTLLDHEGPQGPEPG